MARTTRLDHDALDRLLIQQLDVISRRQALVAGVTDNALRHRLRPAGPWRGLLPGVYMAATGAPTTLQQEMAALLYAGPGSVITGPAALRSHHIRCELTEIVDVLVHSSGCTVHPGCLPGSGKRAQCGTSRRRALSPMPSGE